MGPSVPVQQVLQGGGEQVRHITSRTAGFPFLSRTQGFLVRMERFSESPWLEPQAEG